MRELAKEKKWTLREVSKQTDISYGTARSDARSPTLATVDYTALIKLARVFAATIEDLVEVLEE